MRNILSILKILLPVIISLGIGFFARKRDIFSPEAIEGMKTLVMKFALPSLVFGLFFTAEYSWSMLLFGATIFVMGFAGLGIGLLIGKPLEKRSPMLKYMTTGWEVGMLGYALYALLFGAENLHNMAMLAFGHILFIFSGYFAALYTRIGCTRKESLKALVTNPIPLAMLAGALLALFGVSRALAPSGVTELIKSICDFVAAPLSCVILIVVGYGIKFSRENLITAAISVALRVLVCSVLCTAALLFIGTFVPLTKAKLWAIIILFTLPASFLLTMFATSDREHADVSMSLSMQTIFSILVFIGITIFLH
jgi:predicted permease